MKQTIKELGDRKESVYQDLSLLATIINDSKIGIDVEPIIRASGRCHSNSNKDFWVHKMDSLVFELLTETKEDGSKKKKHKRGGGTIPIDADNYLKIELSLNIKGRYYQEEIIEDPLFQPYSLDLEISGDRKNGGGKIYSAWHFDKHGEVEDAAYTHPEYHWTFGGNLMEAKLSSGFNFGDTFILPAPRISHPPFDIVLAIDFVFGNYFPINEIQSILQNEEYQRIVFNSQYRLWRPYAISLLSCWEKLEDINNQFHSSTIFPNLIFK